MKTYSLTFGTYINFNIKIKRKGMKWQKRWFRWAPRKMQSKMSKCIWTRSASPQRVKLAQHTWQEARQLWIIQRGFRAHSPVQFISIIQIRTRNWDYKLNIYKTLYCHWKIWNWKWTKKLPTNAQNGQNAWSFSQPKNFNSKNFNNITKLFLRQRELEGVWNILIRILVILPPPKLMESNDFKFDKISWI